LWLKSAVIDQFGGRLFDEGFISEEFRLKVMSMKHSDFSRWNSVADFQTEVLS
jgi:hypothetical protein